VKWRFSLGEDVALLRARARGFWGNKENGGVDELFDK